jgi:hypothetical protein
LHPRDYISHTLPPSPLQFMVMSFKMKKLLIYEKEDDMETGGPLSTYEFRYVV